MQEGLIFPMLQELINSRLLFNLGLVYFSAHPYTTVLRTNANSGHLVVSRDTQTKKNALIMSCFMNATLGSVSAWTL